MSFICKESRCDEWAKFQCKCKLKIRLCNKHMPQHSNICKFPSISLQSNLNDTLSMSLKGVEILENIKFDLLTLSQNSISAIREITKNSIEELMIIDSKISKWAFNSHKKSLESKISSLKKFDFRKRSTAKLVSCALNLLALKQEEKTEENECFEPEHIEINEKYLKAIEKNREYEEIIQEYQKLDTEFMNIRQEHEKSLKKVQNLGYENLLNKTDNKAAKLIEILTNIIEKITYENIELKKNPQANMHDIQSIISENESLNKEISRLKSVNSIIVKKNEEIKIKLQEFKNNAHDVEKGNKKLVTFNNQNSKNIYDDLKNIGLPGFEQIDKSLCRVKEILLTGDQVFGIICN